MVIEHVAYLLQLIFHRDLRKAAASAAAVALLHVNVVLVIPLSRGVLPPRCRTTWSRGAISIFLSPLSLSLSFSKLCENRQVLQPSGPMAFGSASTWILTNDANSIYLCIISEVSISNVDRSYPARQRWRAQLPHSKNVKEKKRHRCFWKTKQSCI